KTNPSIDLDEHEALSRCKRVRVYGNDGANFNGLVVNSDGSINALVVGGSFTFTGTISSTATVNIATSVTLNVNQAVLPAHNVTAFLAGAVTLNVLPPATQTIAGTVTSFVAGSATLFVVPPLSQTIAGTVTSFVAGSVTLNVVPPATMTVAGTVTTFL